MDIAEWLRSLRLEQYVPTFAEQAIHWDVLPKLTAADLKEIGMATVDDRRGLLEAITSRPAQTPESPVVASPVPSGAERRQ